MKTKWSRSWVSSKQPRKQRKYRYNAPPHIRTKFISAHLSKELREKYKRRSIRLRVGDTVKIMRGEFKGKTGKVEKIFTKIAKVTVSGIQKTKPEKQKRGTHT